MDSIKEDFDARVNEINNYLKLLEFIENSRSISDDKQNTHEIDITLKCTLKGMVFLLLYNLTEATMRESIAHIYDQIDQRAIDFNQLKESIRKEILRKAKSEKVGLDILLAKTAPSISQNLAAATFNKKDLFPGNIDHKEVTNQARIYGFNTATEYSETKHGENLKTIKKKRNDLAHGNDSFADIGKNYATSDLNDFAKEVINYLNQITSHISEYVKTQSYLHDQQKSFL